MFIPPHLVVLALKLAAGRVAYKGAEAGIGMASRRRALRTAPEDMTAEEREARAEAAERRGRQAVHVMRHVRHIRHL